MSNVTDDFLKLVEAVTSGGTKLSEGKDPRHRELRRKFMKLPDSDYEKLLRLYHDTAKYLPSGGNLKSLIVKAVESGDRVEVWNALVSIGQDAYSDLKDIVFEIGFEDSDIENDEIFDGEEEYLD